MKWRAYGVDAVLVHFAEKPDESAFHSCRSMVQALDANAPPGVIEFVPGYVTLLLRFSIPSGDTLETLAAHAVSYLAKHAHGKVPPGTRHEIPVRYNGPDLQRVAEVNHLEKEEVIRLHTEPVYHVYLLGFAPGFPYLGVLPPELATPRLAAPRLRVPAGSVAIGGEHTGIYSVDSPGGWNIIGQTSVKIFDLSRHSPDHEEAAFLLKPGDQVQFVAV